MKENNISFLKLSPQAWEALISKVGFPILALTIIIYLIGWKFGPQLVNGHLKFLERTASTVEKTSEAQREISVSVQKVNDSVADVLKHNMSADDFYRKVAADHNSQLKELENVNDNLDNLGEAIDRNTKRVADTLEAIRKQSDK